MKDDSKLTASDPSLKETGKGPPDTLLSPSPTDTTLSSPSPAVPPPLPLAEQFSNVPSRPSQPGPLPSPSGVRDPTSASGPGAYRSAPGAAAERLVHVSYNEALRHPQDETSTLGSNLASTTNTLSTVAINTTSTADTELVEARMVDDAEAGSPAIAVPHNGSPQVKEKESHNNLIFLLAFLVLLGAIFLILGLTGFFHKNTATAIPAPPPSPAEILKNQLFGNLTNSSSTLQALQDPSSPQSQALQWMLQQNEIQRTYPIARLRQRFALVTIYYAFTGKLWKQKTHWLDPNKHECEWYATGSRNASDPVGYETTYPSPCHHYQPQPNSTNHTSIFTNKPPNTDENPMYARLWLRNNTLNGTIPDEIYWLTTLNSLDLSYSSANVAGTLSTQIGLLTNLVEFRISQGVKEKLPELWLHGTIPTEVGLLTNLKVLDVGRSGHYLNGTFPMQVYTKLTNLDQLLLSGNMLTGTIPTEIGLLTKMSVLTTSANQFTGTLPSEMGLLTDLVYTYQYGNFFTGTIPTEVGRMTQLIWLWLHLNQLTGTIPTEVGLLAALQDFPLQYNHLGSSLPTEIGRMEFLRFFDISGNQFSGTLMTELDQLTHMEKLLLQGNQFYGLLVHDEAPFFGNLTRLVTLDLSRNYFTGTMPEEWSNLVNLEDFTVCNNSLTGTVPVDLLLGAWENINRFDVSENSLLSGTFPDVYCQRSLLPPEDESFLVLNFNCTDRLCGCGCDCTLFSNQSMP